MSPSKQSQVETAASSTKDAIVEKMHTDLSTLLSLAKSQNSSSSAEQEKSAFETLVNDLCQSIEHAIEQGDLGEWDKPDKFVSLAAQFHHMPVVCVQKETPKRLGARVILIDTVTHLHGSVIEYGKQATDSISQRRDESEEDSLRNPASTSQDSLYGLLKSLDALRGFLLRSEQLQSVLRTERPLRSPTSRTRNYSLPLASASSKSEIPDHNSREPQGSP